MDYRIRRIVRHIVANRSANVRELAELVNLSPSHLRHLFKATMGTTIVQYTIARKLEHARHLLITTDWPVKRIAIECGIPNGPNFGRFFKRRFGVRPSEFRKHHSQSSPSLEDDAGEVHTI